MSSLAKWLFSLTLLSGGLYGLLISSLSGSLIFESLESKTIELKPVFNQIKFISGERQDVWMMNQSHHGWPSGETDRLAIVVDKQLKTAKFYQLNPGPLEWEEPVKSVDYKVSCFMCHSNGLRAIRPNFTSKTLAMNPWQKTKVLAWNMRIKSYGRLTAISSGSQIPLRLPGEKQNEVLQVKVCTTCHRDEGFLARGSLTRQNFSSIRFMINNGLMPPFGLPLDEESKKEIGKFLAAP